MDWLTRVSFVGASAMCLLHGPGCAEVTSERPIPNVYWSAEQAAQHALDELQRPGFTKSSDAEQYAKDLGFASAAEASNAQLGSPLRIYNVGLERLGRFESGGNPNNLLIDSQTLIYPLVVNGQHKSAVTVSGDGASWRVAAKGYPKLVRRIQKQNPSSASFLVLTLPFRSQFIGSRKVDELMLTPIDESPPVEDFRVSRDQPVHEEDFRVGREQPAKDVFTKLAPLARTVLEKTQRARNIVDQERGRPRSPETVPEERPASVR